MCCPIAGPSAASGSTHFRKAMSRIHRRKPDQNADKPTGGIVRDRLARTRLRAVFTVSNGMARELRPPSQKSWLRRPDRGSACFRGGRWRP
jgi:hypothetical protein